MSSAFALAAFTPLTNANVAAVPMQQKVIRSLSVGSNISTTSTSSQYSRVADDLLDRLAAQECNAVLHLWSSGNVRLGCGRDLTVPAGEAIELIEAMQKDPRFEVTVIQQLNDEGDDWKVRFMNGSQKRNGLL